MKKNGMKAIDAAKIALSASLGNLMKLEIDSKSNTITFDISRAGRIKHPRSGALLARYANALARDAFDHDLTRRSIRPLVTEEKASSETEAAVFGPVDESGADVVLNDQPPVAESSQKE
jgi:hypothetical protein